MPTRKPTTKRSHRTVRHLPPEGWGHRLQRARNEIADMTVHSAAAEASRYWQTTHATVNRIEQLPDAPDKWTAPSRRAIAYVLCRIYGVYPADWQLSRDDVPPSVAEKLDADFGPDTPPEQVNQPSRCTVATRHAA